MNEGRHDARSMADTYMSGRTWAEEWQSLQCVRLGGMWAYAEVGEMAIARAIADHSEGCEKVSPVQVLAVLRAFHRDTEGR